MPKHAIEVIETKLTPKLASRIMRKHFAEVTPEQFRENNRRFNPHLFTSDSAEAPTEKAEIADNMVGDTIPVLQKEPESYAKRLPQSASADGGRTASKMTTRRSGS